jgi:hypothetical protein
LRAPQLSVSVPTCALEVVDQELLEVPLCSSTTLNAIALPEKAATHALAIQCVRSSSLRTMVMASSE